MPDPGSDPGQARGNDNFEVFYCRSNNFQEREFRAFKDDVEYRTSNIDSFVKSPTSALSCISLSFNVQ